MDLRGKLVRGLQLRAQRRQFRRDCGGVDIIAASDLGLEQGHLTAHRVIGLRHLALR